MPSRLLISKEISPNLFDSRAGLPPSSDSIRRESKLRKSIVELSNGSGWAKLELAYAYAVAGNKAESDRIVNEVTAQPEPFSPYDMATICAVWRDTDGAFRWLEKAIEQRSVDVIWIRVDPRLDPVRSDPRFAEVLARLAPRRQLSPAPK